MKIISLIAVTIAMSATAFAVDNKSNDKTPAADQSWSCQRDDTGSAALLAKYWKKHPQSRKGNSSTAPMGMGSVRSFSVDIQDGKLADLHMEGGFSTSSEQWNLADAASDSYYNFVQPTENKFGKVSFEANYDYYDHDDYTITIDPNRSEAVIHSGGEQDCGDGPHEYLAAYTCRKK